MDSLQSVSDLAIGRAALLAGDPARACEVLARAVAAAPTDVEARYWLASAQLTAGAPGAAAALDEARTLHALMQARSMGADLTRLQTDAAYATDIAERLYGQKQVAMSGVVRRMALAQGAMDAPGLLSYALSLMHQGRPDEACEVFHAAAENFPTAPVAQFEIYPQLMCADGEARHAAAARAWARRFAPGAPAAPHANPGREGRRLHIGYVAPWLGQNQARQFITPVLENHDPAAVSVTLYTTDAASEVGWPGWIDVHPIGDLSDADAAALIRRDGIDVLADCWGHSAGSRLAIFAQRPAPVQVAWINYIQTTGLEQMDYVLHADAPTPPGLEALLTERIWRIGPVFNAFRPAPDRPPTGPTPALAAGRVTFGSFNHPVKISGAAMDGWAAVLRGAPTSRLLLKYGYFDDGVLQRVTQARFAARGVAPERIVFAGHTSGAAYHAAFDEVDLMLDAWPAPGSTTNLEALSHGVPVVNYAEPSFAGLYARTLFDACGLADLVTDSPDAFVGKALELASDLPRLDALRQRIRPAFEASALRDEVGFTRRLEATFGEMFDLWRTGADRSRSAA